MSKTVSELLDQFIDEKRLRFEGDKGVEALGEVAQAIGYSGHSFRYGSPLESFLSDNPGACEALINWIGEQGLPEWKENLEAEVEEETDEDDEDS